VTQNEISGAVVDAAYRVHCVLGPGLLESAYETALAHEIGRRGLSYDRQVAIPICYDGITLDAAFRADIIVEGKIVVEVKSVEHPLPVHKKQVSTYLRLTDLRLGLLLNFNVVPIKDGISRIVHRLEEANT
jgi:GxxExxY protein